MAHTDGLSDAAAADLLAALVRIPSVNPAFRQPGDPDDWFNEARVAGFVAGWLRNLGIEVEIDAVSPDRPNVIARLRGTGNGPAMLWEGHLDTVQVTGLSEPFTPRIEGGRLYGRGAVDDKGCLAAFMLALRDLAQDPPPGDVTFLAAVDEEYRFAGITHHLKRGERYDLGIAGEPTNLRIVRACKGCVRWHVEVLGRAAHSAKPHEGVDAVVAATGLLAGYRRRHGGAHGKPSVARALHAGLHRVRGGRGTQHRPVPRDAAVRLPLSANRRGGSRVARFRGADGPPGGPGARGALHRPPALYRILPPWMCRRLRRS